MLVNMFMVMLSFQEALKGPIGRIQLIVHLSGIQSKGSRY
jgi:hypothetical protein